MMKLRECDIGQIENKRYGKTLEESITLVCICILTKAIRMIIIKLELF